MTQTQNKNCAGCGGCGSKKSSGGCCKDSGGCGGGCGSCQNRTIEISEREKDFLLLLAQIPFLPLARFYVNDSAGRTDSGPVYLDEKDDTAEKIRESAATLMALSDKYLITLDYDKPLQNYDYAVFEKSAAYEDFRSTPNTASPPAVEHGSIALTTLGQDVLDSMMVFM